MRHAWFQALPALALVALAACTPGPTAVPLTSSAQPVATGPTANWRSYASYAYGYTFKYPPQWIEVFGGQAGNVDFTTEQGVGAPLQMSPAGVFVDISPYCFGTDSRDVIVEQSSLAIGQMTIPRKVVFFNPPASEHGYMATARIDVGPYCYRVQMIGLALPAVQANLADFDLMLTSMKFGVRSAPIITPPGF